MNRAAIYAGTFDPITFGHLDVVERAARMFPRLILAVAEQSPKSTLFTARERVAIAREASAPWDNVEVEAFEGLLVEYARRKRVRVLVRGLRAFSDFEFEFQMALTNKKLAPDVEFVCLMTSLEYAYLSSSILKEIAVLGGDITTLAPDGVQDALRVRFAGLDPSDASTVPIHTSRD